MPAPPPLRPLRLRPALIDRVWAGHRLRDVLRKDFANGRPVGEAWEISDHPGGASGFDEPELEGRSFGEVFRSYHHELFGLEAKPGSYPLLLKFIDAGESLSIQVHPDDALARPLHVSGKSECWYIVETEPGGRVLCGFKPGVSPGMLRDAARSGDFHAVLVERPIRPGTFINVPAGTVHAILKGTLVCEISQSSSEIARLWDWGRPPRADRTLDVEGAVAWSHFGDAAASAPGDRPFDLDTAACSGDVLLVRNRHFEVRLLATPAPSGILDVVLDNAHGVIVSVVHGRGRCAWGRGGDGDPVQIGESWLLPAGLANFRLQAEGEQLRLLASRPLSFG